MFKVVRKSKSDKKENRALMNGRDCSLFEAESIDSWEKNLEEVGSGGDFSVRDNCFFGSEQYLPSGVWKKGRARATWLSLLLRCAV